MHLRNVQVMFDVMLAWLLARQSLEMLVAHGKIVVLLYRIYVMSILILSFWQISKTL